MLVISIAWFILHWIANNLASVIVTLTTLCIVLTTGLLKECIFEINMVTWFLILASETTITEEGLNDALNTLLSNFLICFLIFGEQEWKEKWSENKSIRQFPSLNFLLRKENEGKNLLCLLSTLISRDFKQSLCLGVR